MMMMNDDKKIPKDMKQDPILNIRKKKKKKKEKSSLTALFAEIHCDPFPESNHIFVYSPSQKSSSVRPA